MKDYLAEHKRKYKNLSGEIERELDRFVRELENEYVVAILKLAVCKCGRKFLPNTTNNVNCPDHSSDISFERKMKGFEEK